MAKTKKSKLKIISLGGLGEIGKNLTVLEYENDIIVIDCGMGFPDEEMPGIDFVIPDITYLEKNREKVRGIFLTHGHEDHIGAVPYVLRSLHVPVYGTRLTLGILENKLSEHRYDQQTGAGLCESGRQNQSGRIYRGADPCKPFHCGCGLSGDSDAAWTHCAFRGFQGGSDACGGDHD